MGRERVRATASRAGAFVRRHGVAGVVPAIARSVRYRSGRAPTRSRFSNLTAVTNDPVLALEHATPDIPIIDVGFDRLCPYALTIRYSDLRRNPFSRTASDCAHRGVRGYEQSALFDFYDQWQPESLGEVYGTHEGSSEHLRGVPTPDCLPWTEGAWPINLADGITVHQKQMSVLLGRSGEPHGFRAFGPVSELAGERFFEDYLHLTRSIMTDGYQPELGEQPSMELLSDGVTWRGRVLAGNHRCAVLAALGYPSIAMAIAPEVVRRQDAARWHGVRSGIYTEPEALAIFDRFLHARPLDGYPQFAR